jgi:hypothetical protein
MFVILIELFMTDSELMECFNNFNNVMKQWQEIVWFFGPGEHKTFLRQV